jgi:hypothetical protein
MEQVLQRCVQPCRSPAARRSAGRQPGLADGDRDTVASYAMDELYHATMTSHRGKLAGRCAWVMDEDPDLASLRQHDLFRVFEMVTFSRDQPRSGRPVRVRLGAGRLPTPTRQ